MTADPMVVRSMSFLREPARAAIYSFAAPAWLASWGKFSFPLLAMMPSDKRKELAQEQLARLAAEDRNPAEKFADAKPWLAWLSWADILEYPQVRPFSLLECTNLS